VYLQNVLPLYLAKIFPTCQPPIRSCANKFSAYTCGMDTIRQIVDFVGRDKAREALGVSADMLRYAIRRNRAPAAWYDALERLAGRPLDRGLFTFK